MSVNLNKKEKMLYDLFKQYNFEYGVFLEKQKVNESIPNELTEKSMHETYDNIQKIKKEILGTLISEVSMNDDGNINLNENIEEKNNKPFFKFMF